MGRGRAEGEASAAAVSEWQRPGLDGGQEGTARGPTHAHGAEATATLRHRRSGSCSSLTPHHGVRGDGHPYPRGAGHRPPFPQRQADVRSWVPASSHRVYFLRRGQKEVEAQ